MKAVRIFISYRSEDPDLSLAREFSNSLRAANHDVFMASESIEWGEGWPDRIDQELKRCDYFLLFLSKESAASEMVTEEVRQAKLLRDLSSGRKPVILSVRVQLPMNTSLNYDLNGYLNRTQQRQWESPKDTPVLIKEILELISTGNLDSSVSDAPDGLVEKRSDKHIEVSVAKQIDRAPMPVAEPELPQGQVDLESKFYVERPNIDSECLKTITQPGSLIHIKAPRQMGKTSLMARTLFHADKHGLRPVQLSFQLADASIFLELDRLLRWLCHTITWELEIPDRVNEYWDMPLDSKMKCTAYFERYLLEPSQKPIAIGLDEVDLLFQVPEIGAEDNKKNLMVAADFFSMIRGWHESAKSGDTRKAVRWKKLRIVIVHSTEVYIPLKVNESPFNVGLPIELLEFNSDQVLDLAHRHGLPWRESEVDQLMSMVGGHPFLIRVALYYIARGELSLIQLLRISPTEAGLYSDHLRRHLWNLEQYPALAEAMREVVFADEAVQLKSDLAFKLESMGVIRLKDNKVLARCELYRLYFRDRLRKRT